MTTPYTRRVSHVFVISYEKWEVTYFSATEIHFEETRKNGQEDCHMSAEATLVGGKWALDKSGRGQIELYSGERTADTIEAFFNEHGTPKGDMTE